MSDLLAGLALLVTVFGALIQWAGAPEQQRERALAHVRVIAWTAFFLIGTGNSMLGIVIFLLESGPPSRFDIAGFALHAFNLYMVPRWTLMEFREHRLAARAKATPAPAADRSSASCNRAS